MIRQIIKKYKYIYANEYKFARHESSSYFIWSQPKLFLYRAESWSFHMFSIAQRKEKLTKVKICWKGKESTVQNTRKEAKKRIHHAMLTIIL